MNRLLYLIVVGRCALGLAPELETQLFALSRIAPQREIKSRPGAI
jgi:hypothetical protein